MKKKIIKNSKIKIRNIEDLILIKIILVFLKNYF